MVISPSSELGITHYFFVGLLILQEILCQIFSFFLNRLDRLETGLAGSSGQLVWSTDFGDFGAHRFCGSGPSTPDQSWPRFGPSYGPFFLGFLQPTLSPFGFLVVKQRDKCGQLLTS